MTSSSLRPLALGLCAVALVSVISLVLWAQGNNGAPEAPALQPVTDLSAQVVVTVNGKTITEADLQPRVQQAMARFSGAQGLPPALLEQLKPKIRQDILQELINEQLLTEAAAAAHIEIPEEKILEEITQIVVNRNIAPDLETFQKMVAEKGDDFESIKQQVRQGLTFRELIDRQLKGKIDVNDTDVKTYYEGHADEFQVPEQVHVSHILVSTDDIDPNGADPNAALAERRQQAEALLERVRGGEDFATVAKEHSSCPSAAQGGDLGDIRRGTTVPEFEQAAFALPVGQISDLVKTQFGYHIIKVSQHDQAKQLTLAEATDDIRTKLTNEQEQQLARQYIESLKAKATIVYAESPENTVTLTPNQP